MLILIAPAAASAQQSRPSRLAVDTVATIRGALDNNGNDATDLVIDAIVSVDLGQGLEVISWPVVQRLAVTGEWRQDVWIAALRYERAGSIGLRIEGGLLPSPLGLANLTVRRAHLNPTISQPSSLFVPLPSLGDGEPRPNLLGAVYPFGGQVTVSGSRWDARVALIDTSPLRRRGVFEDPKPPRFANLVVGGGVTPFVGFRVGASVTHGGWQRAGESPATTADQNATVVTLESELSFAHTTLAGEWVRDAVGTSSGSRVASGWFAQGRQTLTPRWFVAGRVERIASPLVSMTLVQQQTLISSEETLGYRLTPELTVRAGHRARRSFGRPAYQHEFALSVVWWKRWR
ncbi:MAG: hypothetical protein O2930_16030 [Acidobacteria bacterium]|nr:hypothetical protein [Acidobacteriota bacterium]